MSKRLTICFLFSLLLGLTLTLPFAGKAMAHAIITKSQPASGATLAATIVPVNLHFNSRIDHKRSIVTLTAPNGGVVSLPILPQSPADTILASARSLVPGNYTLHWQVLSVDGHLTRGDIPFTIVPMSTP
jgi:methionine-rich copper-binding protein CopC